MQEQDEKKPPVSGGLWVRIEVLPSEPGRPRVRLSADDLAARQALGSLDVCREGSLVVTESTRTRQRDPATGAFHTTAVVISGEV